MGQSVRPLVPAWLYQVAPEVQCNPEFQLCAFLEAENFPEGSDHVELEIALKHGDPSRMVAAVLKRPAVVGRGSRATVYRIPKMPDYILHVQNDLNWTTLPNDLPLLMLPDPLRGMNIGQAVASMQDGAVKIVRYLPGKTSGIPFAQFFERYGIDNLLGHNQPMRVEETAPYRRMYTRHLKRIARMSQQAYDELARRILRIGEVGLHLDPCSLNVLVDDMPGRERFNTIDHMEPIGPYENLLGMACALLDTMYVDLDEHAVNHEGRPSRRTVAADPALIRLRHEILRKVIRAAYKTGLPLAVETCPLNRFGFRQRAFNMEYALEISGMAGAWPVLQRAFGEREATAEASEEIFRKLTAA
ncbi:MAG TPA: hypothetical protein V6C52_13545 [Coleofasciculaceae cyanobacterium]|jgi:hypothetical protein